MTETTSRGKIEAERVAEVMKYEHRGLVERFERKLGLGPADARQLFKDTKLFLLLCAENPRQHYVPTKAIDEGWHNFILYTRDYASFCDNYFGKFLHHQPHDSFTNHKSSGGALRTLHAAYDAFGSGLSDNWHVAEFAATDPCDSCGCDAACNDD